MYQALYRKYRPNDFENVAGQDIIVKTLCNAIINNKISHAYLFSGPRGTGKTSIAKIFAKTINCEHLDGIHPCDKCVSCTQTKNKQNTDIIEIDAASNNGVDEIRELKSKVTLVPNFSKYKVYIIDEVHMLTTGAFNALLKTLEEPPKHVIFILATTEPQKIPLTILSRCQRYDFKKISIDNIVSRLKYICKNENISIDDDALKEIARISDGGMRDSIGMLDEAISYKNNNISVNDIHSINGTLTQQDLQKFISLLLSDDIENVFNLLDKYNNNGINLNKLLDEIILFLRNTLLYYEVPNYLIKNNIDIAPYKIIKDQVDISKIYNYIYNFNELSIKSKNISNFKIMFEMEILNCLSKPQNISREIIKPFKKNQMIDNKPKNDSDVNNKLFMELNNNINILKKIRISNVLSNLNKKIITEFSNSKEKLKPFLLSEKYGKYISLLLDGNIKASSTDGLIYVYKYSNDSNLFNKNIFLLEKIIKNKLNIRLSLISVNNDEWEIIKDNFNNKKIVYEYKDDQDNIMSLEKIYKKIKDEKKNNKENISIFDDIIEYTEEDI